MKKLISIALLGMLTLTAFSSVPVEQASILSSSGTTDPILFPETDMVTWATVGTAPTIFGRSGGGIIGNYMYSFGSEAVNCAQAYNMTTQQWEASTLAPAGKDNWASATTNEAVYLIAGYDGTTALNRTQKFVPTAGGPQGTWTQMAVYPQTVYGPTAAWDGGDFIYACGGNTMSGYSLTAYKYSISANTWTAIANPPVSQSFSGSAFIGGKFYVFGGTDAAGLGTRHYCYDPASNTWTQKAPVPTAVWFATSSTTFNNEYMISCGGGGGYGSWPAINAVQIYNPVSNTWAQETALPVARGCNIARWAGNGTVISGGGYGSGAYSGVTYKGTGFFGPPPNMTIAMTPSTTPITIPAGGGSFNYTIAITNLETTPQGCQVWVMITLPNGQSYGPVLGPVTATIGGSATVTRLRTQNVPASAPSGAYSCVGSVGSYPTAWNSSSFPFTKSASFDGFMVNDWDNFGQTLGDEIAGSFAAPTYYSLEAAYPNPFNPETNLTYNLANAGNVKLSVYDIQGREVAVLLDGFHSEGYYSISFNGANLSSGVYFAVLNANGQTFTQKLMLVK